MNKVCEITALQGKHCVPCEGGIEPLKGEEVKQMLVVLPKWQTNETCTRITRVYEFKGFYKTMAFVNAIAWIANEEKHHPDLEVSYNRCVVHFTTHAINGLSENDFICAAKVEQLNAS